MPAVMEGRDLDAELDRLTEEIRPQARAEAWRAFQRAPHALELDELHSIALTGLAQARHRWLAYCESNGYSPYATNFFAAYSLRRIRGAILDAMRANDWVTRAARTRAKQLRDAGQDRGLTEAELTTATGLTAREIRDTSAAVAARPVSLDAEPHDVADCTDVEGAAVVSSVLEVVADVIAGLDEVSRTLLVLRYYEGLPLAAAGETLGLAPDEAREAHERAVLLVHNEMLKAVALWDVVLRALVDEGRAVGDAHLVRPVGAEHQRVRGDCLDHPRGDTAAPCDGAPLMICTAYDTAPRI